MGSFQRGAAPARGRFHGGCAWCVPLDGGIQPRWRLVPMCPHFLFETSKRKRSHPVKRKNVRRDFGREGPKVAYHTGAGREMVPPCWRWPPHRRSGAAAELAAGPRGGVPTEAGGAK